MKKTFHKAFTLVEVLIASSVLMVIVVLSIGVFYNITRANTYLELTSMLQFEAKHTMERMVRLIQSNTIDYPEYYNYYVLHNGGVEFTGPPNSVWGASYTAYASRFYDPGDIPGSPGQAGNNFAGLSPDQLGSNCGAANYPLSTDPACESLPTLSYTEDTATGRNPHSANLPIDQASSMCDLTTEMYTEVSVDRYQGCNSMSTTGRHRADMLFLISPDGQTKTLIGREPWTVDSLTPWGDLNFQGGYVVSMLKMTGSDNDNDGVPELWTCHGDFACTDVTPDPNGSGGFSPIPIFDDLDPTSVNISTLDDIGEDFAPFSTPLLHITELDFYIAPIEDPNKAFNEPPEQIQPYVTIVMTAEINQDRAAQLPENLRSITLQTSVSTQFYGEITSYVSN